MAKNSVDSTVVIRNKQIVKLEGRLVEQSTISVTFQYRPKAQRRIIQQIFPRADVAAVSDDVLYVLRDTSLLKIAGNATQDKTTGFIEVDGTHFNPAFCTVEADLGVPADGATPAKAKTAKKKKAK